MGRRRGLWGEGGGYGVKEGAPLVGQEDLLMGQEDPLVGQEDLPMGLEDPLMG